MSITIPKCCKIDVPVRPPLSKCVRPDVSPFGHCGRFKNISGAGLGILVSPVLPNHCACKRFSHADKDYLVSLGYWNFSSELRPNSPLANRLNRLQNRNAQR